MSDLRRRTPKVLGAPALGRQLTAEERFVLQRIDGRLSVGDLAGLTGLEAAQVERIVTKLAVDGAVDLGAAEPAPAFDDGGTASLSDFAAALGMDPSTFAKAEAVARPAHVAEEQRARVAEAQSKAPPAAEAPPPDEEAEAPADEEAAEPEAQAQPEDPKADDVSRAVAERNYRQVYEARWHSLTVDQRIAGAQTVDGADLFALCFDPDPRVIGAILQNSTVGLDHVRMIAAYHRTGTGLEIVARRMDWIRDLLVERRLLRNPMIGDVVLGRVIAPKRLFQTYKIAIDRDIPDLTRNKVRGQLRPKWQQATSEERSDLLLRTEGRCLILMTGCTFDAKTTSILCGRPINSVMFVQSIAKFGSSPPGLLAHLMKQPFVRKNAPLKKMLLAHPNMPGDVKRGI